MVLRPGVAGFAVGPDASYPVSATPQPGSWSTAGYPGTGDLGGEAGDSSWHSCWRWGPGWPGRRRRWHLRSWTRSPGRGRSGLQGVTGPCCGPTRSAAHGPATELDPRLARGPGAGLVRPGHEAACGDIGRLRVSLRAPRRDTV